MGYREPIPSLHVAWPLQGCRVCCDVEKTVPSAGDSHTAPQLSQPEHPEPWLSSSIQALGVGCASHATSSQPPAHLPAARSLPGKLVPT